MYYFDGRFSEAENEYRQALALNENEPMVHNNLGVIYMNQKKFKEAEDELNYELEINPGYDKAILNLADLKYRVEHNLPQK